MLKLAEAFGLIVNRHIFGCETQTMGSNIVNMSKMGFVFCLVCVCMQKIAEI